MDDLMNKVGALIEEHVKSEVEARALIHSIQIKECQARECSCSSKDEIRRGARALGFWEKLVETLCIGPADEATFGHVMERIQAMEEWKLNAEDCQKQIEVLYERITTVRMECEEAHAGRDEARRTEASFTVQFDAMRKERDTVVQQFEWMREERDAANRSANKYRVMWEQLHRAQSEDLDAKDLLKKLLAELGLSHFDRDTIKKSIELSRKRDLRLRSERDDAWAARDIAERRYQESSDKVQALEAQLLEVRKAAGEAPEKHAVRPDGEEAEEIEGFRVGDLVQLANMQPPHVKWQAVTKLEGDGRVRYGKYDAYAPHMLARKPVEAGDRVRIVGGNPLHVGSTFVVRRMSNNGLAVGDLGSWSLHNIVAVAP